MKVGDLVRCRTANSRVGRVVKKYFRRSGKSGARPLVYEVSFYGENCTFPPYQLEVINNEDQRKN